jgi:hypothetical protein
MVEGGNGTSGDEDDKDGLDVSDVVTGGEEQIDRSM